MNGVRPTQWSIFCTLCKVLGGQDKLVLSQCIANGWATQLFDIASQQNLLPALAVRCNQQKIDLQTLTPENSDQLHQALHDNTLRNMHIIAQTLKLCVALNLAGITPLLLKGTAQLLTENYSHIGFRKQIDIDFIVEPHEIQRAADILLSDGYQFLAEASVAPILISDSSTAMKVSAAHHHLTPLVKISCVASVELHRHFLPKRFQRCNPLKDLFHTAVSHKHHGATFLVPSDEFQIIHMILGKFVHDGYMSGYDFPLREACDYLNFHDTIENNFDQRLVEQRCGKSFATFSLLVRALMKHMPSSTISPELKDISKRMGIMQRKYNSPRFGRWIDRYARIMHLSQSLAHSPAKFPAYFDRIVLKRTNS